MIVYLKYSFTAFLLLLGLVLNPIEAHGKWSKECLIEIINDFRGYDVDISSGVVTTEGTIQIGYRVGEGSFGQVFVGLHA